MIRRTSAWLAAALIFAMAWSSCTCHKEEPVAPTPSALPTRPPLARPTLAPAATHTVPAAAPTAAATAAAQGTLTVPDDFPPDVPIREDATLAAVQQLGGGAHNVLFTSPANPRQIFSFYKDALKEKGHEVTQEYETNQQSFLSFKKGQLVTNVVIAPDPTDKTRQVIAIMYQIEDDVDEF